MTTFGNDPLHAPIDARLAEIVKTTPVAAWHEAWMRLRPESTEDERLRVYQADWVDELAEAVAGCLLADDPTGSIGYRSREEDGCWEVDLYPTPVELVGGAADGAVVAPGFSLDLRAIQVLFERVDAVSWNTHGYHGSDAPFVAVEGTYEGRDVWLRVLCAAPEGEEPGLKIKVSR